MVKTYPKGQNLNVSSNFKLSEFECPCDECTTTLLDSDLVYKLENMRTAIDRPLRINSGFRCANYQADLRARGYETAVGISQHQLGRAADIMSEPATGLELEVVARSVGFRAVGVGHSWIHLDLRDDKDRRWTYVKR